MRRLLLRASGAVALAALLVGPSAQAHAPQPGRVISPPAGGHPTNEWLMMGPHCGASTS